MNIKNYDFYHKLRMLSFVDAIWLYGSRARAQETQRSDFDLAILCPNASDQDWQTVCEIINDADSLIKIDAIRFDALDKNHRLRENILKDKIVLFERKPNSYTWYASFLELGESLDQLEEMVNEPETAKSYVRDATIQRFEFCVELFWKTLKKIALAEQFEVTSPRSALQKAFEMHLIEDEAVWHEMLNDRNLTSHAYHRELALTIYYKIDAYYKKMHQAYERIREQYGL